MFSVVLIWLYVTPVHVAGNPITPVSGCTGRDLRPGESHKVGMDETGFVAGEGIAKVMNT
jgi:hypothetical protein